ncbi:hypothetical protein VTO42DRAFT_5451 [Malbranchea cinnamomea]
MELSGPWRPRRSSLGTAGVPLRWLFPLFLFLMNAALVTAKCAADYFVRSLPGQPAEPPIKMHAGHIEVDPEHNGNLFFWHFHNRHIADRQRTVVWLNGGPGCSSMDGALMEVGPYRVKEDSTLEYNKGSWNEFANLLFVDNPVGTGFSYVDTNSYLHELDEMADQFVVFLEKWFELFPEYENDDLYFAGESYAGQHIPYIAKAILERNKKLPAKESHRAWNLKGMIIGNGWISPFEQYHAYLSFAYDEGLIQGGTDKANLVERQMSLCLSELNAEGGLDRVHISACEDVLTEVLRVSSKDKKCTNMYDIRLTDTYPSCGMNWPPDLKYVTPYLRQRNVTDALNLNKPGKDTGWSECSGAVNKNFHTRNSKPSVQLLPSLLEAGISVTLFSGDKDYICNHLGTEDLINNLAWSGGTGFELSPGVWAPRRDWTFEGEPAGFYQMARNLTYVLFYNASHMVPFDYPRRSRDMLDRIINVDINDIGGMPADSRIDGAKTNPTSVGAHPNSTLAEQQEEERLKEATWNAYYKSGEVALVVVILIAAVWGFFVWRARRRRHDSGYRGIYPNGEALSSGSLLSRFRNKNRSNGDIEAGDFDEAELDNLRQASSSQSASGDGDRDHYAIGDDTSDEEDEKNHSNEPKSILKKPQDSSQ